MIPRTASLALRGLLAALCAAALTVPVDAQTKKSNTAARPIPRAAKDERAQKRHQAILAFVKKGDLDLVFLGDSITEQWGGNGRKNTGAAIWNARYEPLKAANLGVGADSTQHALWRITRGGELKGLKPKLVVLMMGINNVNNGNSAEQIAEGHAAIIKAIQDNHAATKVLLVSTFPAGKLTGSRHKKKFRPVVKALNALLAKQADGDRVRFLDIHDKFLDARGELTNAISSDEIHLTARGYQIWADAIGPTIDELVGKPSDKPTPSTGGKLAWGKKVSAEFRTKVVAIAREIGVDPSDLMACMAFESAETFRADIVNKSSGATGLIQFMPSTARDLGTTTDALKKMTAVEQLDYVRKYFLSQKGKLKNIDDLYMAILWPDAVGKPDDYVLFSKDDKKTARAYSLNAGLDRNKDGKVTKAEAAAAPRAKLTRGLGDSLASPMP
jgi:lysophospholipase L1-like esterase